MVLIDRSYEIPMLEEAFWVWSYELGMVGFTGEVCNDLNPKH